MAVETFLDEDNLAGFKKARVINNIDPSGEGQLMLFIPDIMPNVTESDTNVNKVESVKPVSDIFEGSQDFQSNIKNKATSGNAIWCRPAGNLVEIGTKTSNGNVGGSFKVPQIGTWVTVFFDNEDPNRPYYLPFSISNHSEVIAGKLIGMSSINPNSKTNWESPEGRVLIEVLAEYYNENIVYIDNNENANAFVIQWANGHELIVHHADESGIRLSTEKGHVIHLDENSTELRLKTHSGNVQVTYRDSEGKIAIDQTGDYSQRTGGNLNIEISGSASVKASSVNIEASDITINGGITNIN